MYNCFTDRRNQGCRTSPDSGHVPENLCRRPTNNAYHHKMISKFWNFAEYGWNDFVSGRTDLVNVVNVVNIVNVAVVNDLFCKVCRNMLCFTCCFTNDFLIPLAVILASSLDTNNEYILERNPTNSKLSLIHIWRCRRSTLCRSRWSPYH